MEKKMAPNCQRPEDQDNDWDPRNLENEDEEDDRIQLMLQDLAARIPRKLIFFF